MKASVVIPSHNRPGLIVRTVASLLAQTAAGDHEILIVDDASVPPVGQAFGVAPLPSHVRILRREENRGRAAARNAGIRESRGRVVVFLDDDMEVVPGFLDAHLAVHAEGTRIVGLGRIVAAPELGNDPFLRYLDSRGPEKVLPGTPVPARYFVTGNSSVPRAALEEVGLFDEAFRLYGGEDTDLGMRLAKAGYALAYEPRALARHLEVVSVDRLCERLRAYGRESIPRLVEKHPELWSELSLDVLDPAAWGREPLRRSLRRALFQASLRGPAFRAARALTRVRPLGRVLFPVYDYLRAWSYMTGYLEAVGDGRRR